MKWVKSDEQILKGVLMKHSDIDQFNPKIEKLFTRLTTLMCNWNTQAKPSGKSNYTIKPRGKKKTQYEELRKKKKFLIYLYFQRLRK